MENLQKYIKHFNCFVKGIGENDEIILVRFYSWDTDFLSNRVSKSLEITRCIFQSGGYTLLLVGTPQTYKIKLFLIFFRKMHLPVSKGHIKESKKLIFGHICNYGPEYGELVTWQMLNDWILKTEIKGKVIQLSSKHHFFPPN